MTEFSPKITDESRDSQNTIPPTSVLHQDSEAIAPPPFGNPQGEDPIAVSLGVGNGNLALNCG
ncbi:hypothetical protein AP9108_33395 [Arthrospira sp. PCC 9108]|nr:hypothetical protein AP9108_33395 [Arthrospira sp. PCC 9108]